MFADISYLRLSAILIGSLTLMYLVLRLRRHRERRGDVWLLAAVGAAGLGLGAFPWMADFPTDLLSIGDYRGSRLLALLIIAALVQWYLIASNRQKIVGLNNQVDRLVRTGTVSRFLGSLTEPVPERLVLTVMPALNEAENLAQVLPRIPQAIGESPVRALVIDDGSTDGTVATAGRHGAWVASLPFNRGGGAALRVGYDVANAVGARVLVTLDADGQHNPEEIAELVNPILSDEADVVIGSRVIGSREPDSAIRYLGVRLFSLMINLLLGTRITDCSSGFRAFRVQALSALQLTQDQFHTAELIVEAAKRGLRISERPILIRRRLSGTSKKGANLNYGFGFFKSLVKAWLR